MYGNKTLIQEQYMCQQKTQGEQDGEIKYLGQKAYGKCDKEQSCGT